MRPGLARFVVGLGVGLVVGLAGFGDLGLGGLAGASAQASRAERALAPQTIGGASLVAWPRRPLLDAARAAVGVDDAWAISSSGARGRGATVCVVDSGVDLRHVDFRASDGATRVRWVLDVDGTPRGMHGTLEARYGGAVWSREELDAVLGDRARPDVPHGWPLDWHGHGTTVASAALGDGAPLGVEEPGAYAGVAPEAELVVVRALRRGVGGFRDEDVARGVRFCLDPAVGAPSRTAIVLALGGHDGAHDGEGPLERVLAQAAHAGAAVVVAAGNDGERAIHARVRAVADAPATMTLRVPSPEEGVEGLVAIVVRGAPRLRVGLPSGVWSAWARAGESVQSEGLVVRAVGDAHYVVWQGVRAGEVVLDVRGERASAGREVDAWLVEASLGATLFAPRFVGSAARPARTITIPATANGVVRVGASVSRDFLAGETGPGLTADADEVGRATFSSIGPRVDGAAAPTVLAPGAVLVTARSLDVEPSDPENLVGGSSGVWSSRTRGADRFALSGSSLSAGFVGGLVALGRAQDPDAALDEAAVLAASAESSSEAAWDARRGAGQVDAVAYIARHRALAEAREARAEGVAFACTVTRVRPDGGAVHVVARARAGGVGRFALSVDGRVVGTLALADGLGEAALVLPARTAGEIWSITARGEGSGEESIACELPVTLDDGLDDGSELAIGGGGCAIVPGARGSVALAGLATLALVVRAAARRSRSRGRS